MQKPSRGQVPTTAPGWMGSEARGRVDLVAGTRRLLHWGDPDAMGGRTLLQIRDFSAAEPGSVFVPGAVGGDVLAEGPSLSACHSAIHSLSCSSKTIAPHSKQILTVALLCPGNTLSGESPNT